MVAADYDGTYTDHPEIHGLVDIIITGNHWDQYQRMIDESGVDIPIFFNPDKEELEDIIQHKANIINKLGVTKYYEDQEVQVNTLKLLCPKCKIVRVFEGRNVI